MTTYLINHLRIPGDVPTEAGLSYLEQVESTAKAYGGKWQFLRGGPRTAGQERNRRHKSWLDYLIGG